MSLSSVTVLRPRLLDDTELLCKLFKESISPYSFAFFGGEEGRGEVKNNKGRKIALAPFSSSSVTRSSCQKDAAGSLPEAGAEHGHQQHQGDGLLQRPAPRVAPGRVLGQRALPALPLAGSQGAQQG